MQTSEKTQHLVKAFSAFSANVLPMSPDQEGAYGGFLSLGKILSQTQGDLISAGLIVIQTISNQEGGVTVTSRLIHVESNEWIECSYTMTPERSGPQAEGAVISYCRRYSLMTLLGLSVEQGEDIDTKKDRGVALKARPAAAPQDPTTGVILSKADKKEARNGSPYIAIRTSDGRSATSYDEDVIQQCVYAYKQQTMVTIDIQDIKGHNKVMAISAVLGSPVAEPAPLTDDDIPF